MADPAQSYADIENGHRVAATNPIIPKNLSVPNKSADSTNDFINYILAFEKKYFPIIVFSALQKALPALRAAHSDVDRI